MKKIIFTVTNDLATDQRMIRICTSLQNNGYEVTLVGRKSQNKLPSLAFSSKRLFCFFNKGPLFYAEINLRLFFYLLFSSFDIVCAIDLDTIMPAYFTSKLKGKIRVLDSHEYFTEMKEVLTRPRIYQFWHWVEKHFMPQFKYGYTVSESIAEVFKQQYGLQHQVVRNLPLLRKKEASTTQKAHFIYQGAVNEARGLEFLIPAMADVTAELHIYGAGNFLEQANALVKMHQLKDKVFFKGVLSPSELNAVTGRYLAGLNLVEPFGKSQLFSLANKFFDYIMAGIPQITMNFVEYAKINQQYEVAVLLDELSSKNIAAKMNLLLTNLKWQEQLSQNCVVAKEVLNWQQEENKLLAFYHNLG